MREAMIIGGRRVTSDVWLTVTNPADPAEMVGEIPSGTAADVHAAVAAARAANAHWRTVPLTDRIALLREAADRCGDLTHSVPALLTREMGKIVAESRMDLGGAQAHLRTAADLAEEALKPQLVVSDEFGSVELVRKAVGVVGTITPWNWPLGILLAKVAYALAAGNCVVSVPSPVTSLSTLNLMARIASVLPPGVVNVVTGEGSVVGAALAAHPDVGALAFTGGTVTGRAIMATASPTLKKLTLELGGNDPAVILDDVEINDDLASRLIAAAMTTSGQVCMAVKRVYVHRSAYDDLIEACADALDRSVVGDGLDPASTMGPLATRAQADRAQRLHDAAVAEGGTVLVRGRRGAKADGAGYFRPPALVTGVRDDSDVVAGEQFAPLLPILAFDDVHEAVRRANESPFGLSASVWSSDPDRARSVAAMLDGGTTFINQHGLRAVERRAPMGGVKHSGFGRELGHAGFDTFTHLVQINGRVVASR
jgi:aldehyde dehydrogenase